MRQINLAKDTEEALIAAYAHAAIQRAKARSTSVANRHASRSHDIACELKRRGPEAQAKLLPLLSHESPEVRAWAATHALGFAPEQAEPVLRSLAQEPGMLGFDVRMTLRLWEQGTLELP